MSNSIKCRNCGHEIDLIESPKEWFHKSKFHNDNCECRKAEPDWKPIQEEIKKAMIDKAMKDYKLPRYDRSRGWDSIPFEEKYRPFTI